MAAAAQFTTPREYFIDLTEPSFRAYSATHTGPFRWPLGPLSGLPTPEAVREWMTDHFNGATEVEAPKPEPTLSDLLSACERFEIVPHEVGGYRTLAARCFTATGENPVGIFDRRPSVLRTICKRYGLVETAVMQ